MSKSRLASALVLGALLAATNLAAMTTVAHAQAIDAPTGRQATRRPPTQTLVGESWHQRPPTNQSAVAGDARRPPSEGQVGEPWHLRVHPPAPPAEPDGQPSWRPIASLIVLTAALALAGGLAATRASRRARPRLTA
jgi:hypothetical protein